MADGTATSGRTRLKRLLLGTKAGRVALVAPRVALALRDSRLGPQLAQIMSWGVRSREIGNFTYETTRESKLVLAGVVAEIAKRPIAEIVGYVDELAADQMLAAHVARVSQSASPWSTDPGFRPGRRLAFYLLARALKPARVVEAGVDKGLGAVLVCRALALNAADGHHGDYLGLEFDPSKPIPLYETHPERRGRILRGDSVALLGAQSEPVDLFIHDTVPDPAHVRAQLAAASRLLSPRGVIASTWTTPELIDHAIAADARLLTHQEETIDHWFPGDRVGFIFGFPSRATPP